MFASYQCCSGDGWIVVLSIWKSHGTNTSKVTLMMNPKYSIYLYKPMPLALCAVTTPNNKRSTVITPNERTKYFNTFNSTNIKTEALSYSKENEGNITLSQNKHLHTISVWTGKGRLHFVSGMLHLNIAHNGTHKYYT